MDDRMDDRWQWLDQKARLREAADNLRSEGWEREADEVLRAADEIDRLRAEVASLRLTLGGKTFSATVPEPIGCPMPGACSTVAEIGRLRAVIRVNGLRAGASHEEIDEVVYGKR